MKRLPPSVAKYYKSAPEPQRSTLLEMRERILKEIPGATEVIKYAMPTFLVDGVPLAGLMAHKNHVGYYPYSGSVISKFPEISEKYKATKGALQMPIDKPLSVGEIRKLIKAKMAL